MVLPTILIFLHFAINMCGNAAEMTSTDMSNLTEHISKVQINPQPIAADQIADFCQSYLEVFNTGVHYSFVASVIAMLLSLVIFLMNKEDSSYSCEEGQESCS